MIMNCSSGKDSHHIHSPSPMLSLRQKKREVLDEQEGVKHQIKEFFSEITIRIHELEEKTLGNYENKLHHFFKQVDQYLAFQDLESNLHDHDIMEIMDFDHRIQFNRNILVALTREENLFPKHNTQQISFNKASILECPNWLEFQTTNKKDSGSRQEYEDIINGMERQIEDLMIREEKLKYRISQLENKSKTKKVGNYLFPVLGQEQSNISQLKLQRLEAENKILIQQISECSEKLIGLRSENSIGQSQIITTEKKKPNEVSQIEQDQSQIMQSQNCALKEKISELNALLDNESQKVSQQEKQILRQQERSGQLQKKIGELTDYNERLYSECDANICKKMELQEKAKLLNESFEEKKNELEAVSCKLEDYKKLAELKDERVGELEQTVGSLSEKLNEKQRQCHQLQTEIKITNQNAQTSIKAKQLQLNSLKSIIKKQQIETNKDRELLAEKEESIYNFHQEIKNLQSELTKTTKEKESSIRKQANKIKKQLGKAHEEEKKRMTSEFNEKMGEIIERIEILSKQGKDNKDKYEMKIKVFQNRMELLKAKLNFEVKQIIDKISKTGNKQKVHEVIKSYIESESTIASKNSTIKLLKDELSHLKKNKTSASVSRSPSNANLVLEEIQNLQKTIWTQKMEILQSCSEEKLKEIHQKYELTLAQKEKELGEFREKYNSQQKQLKECKEIVNDCENQNQNKIQKWKQKLEKQSETQKKNEAFSQGLKANINKLQQQNQQLKDQLKTKKDLIQMLKRDVKDKESEKSKLNEGLGGVMQENQKLKRQIKEAIRKEQVYENFKDKLEDKKQIESELEIVRRQMEEQQRTLKAQINKKDSLIKQYKVNEEVINKRIKSINKLEEQNLDLKQKIRKLNTQIDRKDTYAQHLKQKNCKTEAQLESKHEKIQTQMRRIQKQLQAEKLKNEKCRSKIHLSESNLKIFKISILKIYEKVQQKFCKHRPQHFLSTQYQTKNTKYDATIEKTPGRVDLSKYKEGLSILQISGEELGFGFDNEAHTLNACSPIINKIPNQDSVMDLAEALDRADVDNKHILEFFNQILI